MSFNSYSTEERSFALVFDSCFFHYLAMMERFIEREFAPYQLAPASDRTQPHSLGHQKAMVLCSLSVIRKIIEWYHNIKVLVVILMAMLFPFSGSSFAYEPNTQSIDEALATGEVAFIARVVSARETKHLEGMSEAETRFSVIVPLYGIGLKKSEFITLKHFSRHFLGYPKPAFGIQFLISEEYLIVLKRNRSDVKGSYLFNSSAGGDADIAFSVDDSKNSPFFTAGGKEHYYSTMYGLGFKGYVSMEYLNELSKQRVAGLK